MKNLIVYYSKNGENWFDGKKTMLEYGNSYLCAKHISELINSDIFEIKMKQPYSLDYEKCCQETYHDQQNHVVREIYLDDLNIDEYDNIYLCYPIYWSDLPSPVISFLKSFDFKDKKIYPLATHEGSGLANSVYTIKSLCKNSEVNKGLAIAGTIASKCFNLIDNWVKSHSN